MFSYIFAYSKFGSKHLVTQKFVELVTKNIMFPVVREKK